MKPLRITTLLFLIAGVLALRSTLDAVNTWYATPKLEVKYELKPPELPPPSPVVSVPSAPSSPFPFAPPGPGLYICDPESMDCTLVAPSVVPDTPPPSRSSEEVI